MENRLERLEEFKTVLANYHISEDGEQILRDTELVLFVGPTGAGRNALIRGLLKTGNYHSIISDTTRSPRSNNGQMEQNGVEYWFRAEEDMLADLKAGKFLEAALIHNQQVSGISLRELKIAYDQGKIAINEIEIVGTHKIMQVKPDTHALFVIPPSFEEWMKRLEGRGPLPESEKHRRLSSAIKEFDAALEHDYYTFIINDDFDQVLEQIRHYAETNQQNNPEQQTAGRKVTEELLAKTQDYLAAGTLDT